VSISHQQLRGAFAQPTLFLVKLQSDGFEISGQAYEELAGQVVKTRLLRKLFEDGALSCQSKDGVTADNGSACNQCRHPRCRPILRIQILEQQRRYLIDLNASSANNLFTIEDQLHAAGQALATTRLRLTVFNHGQWGEVRFEPLP
jgi:hypothetical protein